MAMALAQVLRQAGEPSFRAADSHGGYRAQDDKVRSPRTNGLVERMDNTLLD